MSAPSISHHAALRWLQRVDARERRPAERVREALARAEPDPSAANTVRDPETGVRLVLGDSGGVVTILVDAATTTATGVVGA